MAPVPQQPPIEDYLPDGGALEPLVGALPFTVADLRCQMSPYRSKPPTEMLTRVGTEPAPATTTTRWHSQPAAAHLHPSVPGVDPVRRLPDLVSDLTPLAFLVRRRRPSRSSVGLRTIKRTQDLMRQARRGQRNCAMSSV